MTIKLVITAGALAAALALPASAANAQSIGQTLFGRVFGTGDTEPAINYSERAPLVVPGKRDLPPPIGKESIEQDPNWPKDPDAAKRLKASADSVGPASSNTELLSQDQLATGTLASGAVDQRTSADVEREYKRMSNPVSPTVLSHKGSFSPNTVPLDPNVCPPRRSLTDPPGCLNKPLASAPLDGNEPLPSEVSAEANKPWYQKVWKFGD